MGLNSSPRFGSASKGVPACTKGQARACRIQTNPLGPFVGSHNSKGKLGKPWNRVRKVVLSLNAHGRGEARKDGSAFREKVPITLEARCLWRSPAPSKKEQPHKSGILPHLGGMCHFNDFLGNMEEKRPPALKQNAQSNQRGKGSRPEAVGKGPPLAFARFMYPESTLDYSQLQNQSHLLYGDCVFVIEQRCGTSKQ